MGYQIHKSPKYGLSICVAQERACPYADAMTHFSSVDSTIFVNDAASDERENHVLMAMQNKKMVAEQTGPFYYLDPADYLVKEYEGDPKLCQYQLSSFSKDALELAATELKEHGTLDLNNKNFREILAPAQSVQEGNWSTFDRNGIRVGGYRPAGLPNELYNHVSQSFASYHKRLESERSIQYDPGAAKAIAFLQSKIKPTNKYSAANIAALELANHEYLMLNNPDYRDENLSPPIRGDVSRQLLKELLDDPAFPVWLRKESQEAYNHVKDAEHVPHGYDKYLQLLCTSAQGQMSKDRVRPRFHVDKNRTPRRCRKYICEYEQHYSSYEAARSAADMESVSVNILGNDPTLVAIDNKTLFKQVDQEAVDRAFQRQYERLGDTHKATIEDLLNGNYPGKKIPSVHLKRRSVDLVNQEFKRKYFTSHYRTDHVIANEDVEQLKGILKGRRSRLRAKTSNAVKDAKAQWYERLEAVLDERDEHGAIAHPALVDMIGAYVHANSDIKNYKEYSRGETNPRFAYGNTTLVDPETYKKEHIEQLPWDKIAGFSFVDVTSAKSVARDPYNNLLEVGLINTKRNGEHEVEESFLGAKNPNHVGRSDQHRLSRTLMNQGNGREDVADALKRQFSDRTIVAYGGQRLKKQIDRELIRAGHRPIQHWIDLRLALPDSDQKTLEEQAATIGVTPTKSRSAMSKAHMVKQLFYNKVMPDIDIPEQSRKNYYIRPSMLNTRDNPAHFGTNEEAFITVA